MSTLGTKEALHKLIDESDESIIKAVYVMLKTYNEDYKVEKDLDEYNRDIDLAMEEIKKGEYTIHEEAIKRLYK